MVRGALELDGGFHARAPESDDASVVLRTVPSSSKLYH